MRRLREGISIVLAGEAGQGIQSIESILTKVLKINGYHVYATKEYMSRIRGGVNSTQIRVSADRFAAFTKEIDVLIVLNQEGIPHLSGRLSGDSAVVGDKESIQYDRLIDVPFSKIAANLGNVIYASTVAVGLICGLLKIDKNHLERMILQYFGKKSQEIRDKNVEAVNAGYQIASTAFNGILEVDIPKNAPAGDVMFSGSEAVALGALAGGCNYVCAYPMTPGTGVFTAMAEYSKTMDIIVEQVEDEIGVINMALGAWYSGARALVSTAGGGFALMCEGISLSGMIETPVVVHVGQRPGPATGLPTRTEQADLNLALYAGHGEFPRVVYTPGTLEEGFYLSQKAFNIAGKYQIPVIILTDQYFVDTYYNIPSPDLSRLRVEKAVEKTKAGYRRYSLTARDGVSPRGIPGWGEGLVRVDSDEHDEMGHITEDLDIRVKMVNKRLAKMKPLEKEAVPPSLAGEAEYETLVVGWGSTYHGVTEALKIINRKGLSFLHFSQVFPLHEGAKARLGKAKKIISIEGNATGQFANLLSVTTGIPITRRILKYDGMPFSVEEIVDSLLEHL